MGIPYSWNVRARTGAAATGERYTTAISSAAIPAPRSASTSEAELVAAEVLALLGAGIAAEEIAVVYRSPVAAAPVLARTFQEYGIPIALDVTVPFGHTALGRGLVALARCALLGGGEASAQDLLDYLRTPGLLERPELADGLELRIRRQGLSTAE